MDNLVTIRTFTFPIDLAIIRGKLESEDIRCFVQDELMSQANVFYSRAIGGARLQVRESDLQRAIEILKEGGYLTDQDIQPSPLFVKLDKATSNIPLIKNLPVEIRFAILGTVIILLFAVAFYLSTLTHVNFS